MEPAGCNLTLQTGSCGVFLFAGSSPESGRGVRVDGKRRELEEEEAVGERRARQISAAHALGMPREI